MTMGQSRHSDGAAEGVKQTPLSVGKRQSSVLARLLGHKLESQVGCDAEAMVRQAVQAVSSRCTDLSATVGMWEVCASLQGCFMHAARAKPRASAPVHRGSMVCSL